MLQIVPLYLLAAHTCVHVYCYEVFLLSLFNLNASKGRQAANAGVLFNGKAQCAWGVCSIENSSFMEVLIYIATHNIMHIYAVSM